MLGSILKRLSDLRRHQQIQLYNSVKDSEMVNMSFEMAFKQRINRYIDEELGLRYLG